MKKTSKLRCYAELADAGADADLGTALALARKLSKDDQAALIKALIGSEGFTFVSGAHRLWNY